MTYPQSLGLFYSAITQRLGLKPQEDEYILMGMAGWGEVDKNIKKGIKKDFFTVVNKFFVDFFFSCSSWRS